MQTGHRRIVSSDNRSASRGMGNKAPILPLPNLRKLDLTTFTAIFGSVVLVSSVV